MTVIEKVARAIHAGLKWSKHYDLCASNVKADFERIAKIVIETMKEPTEEMLQNGALVDSSNPLGLSEYNRAKDNARTSWQAMIDAALKD